MDQQTITADMLVEDILNRWPQTVPIFLQHKMGCVGCSMASFEPLFSALEIYGLDVDLFLAELEQSLSLD